MNAGETLYETMRLMTVECSLCGTMFGIPADMYKRRRDDHKAFWCPRGHRQVFLGESDADKMRRERDRAQQQLARAEDERAAAERAAAAAKADAHAARMREAKERKAKERMVTRAHGGCCIHCNRTFGDLARHMASKHGGLPASRHLLCDAPSI